MNCEFNFQGTLRSPSLRSQPCMPGLRSTNRLAKILPSSCALLRRPVLRINLRVVIGVLLAMGLAAAGPALAGCDVTLSTIFPSDQVVLKADCGGSNISQITWTRDVGLPGAVTLGTFSISPGTQADFSLITPLTSGNHWYTATGWDDTSATAINAGKAVVIMHCAVASGASGSRIC